jgi:hypothetical protein
MHQLRNLFQGLRLLLDRRRTDREIDEGSTVSLQPLWNINYGLE